MNVLIIGAGAIGCLVGGKLALCDHAVTLVGRPHFADTIRQQGLVLRDQKSSSTIFNITAVGSMDEAFQPGAGAYDLAVLTVKSYDTARALAQLATAGQTAGAQLPLVLSLQNGVGNEELIAATVGEANVIAGSISTPVSVPQPGVIQISKAQFSIGLSAWCPALTQDRVVDIQKVLRTAGFSVSRYSDPHGLKWTKLLMNILGNATSAILDEAPFTVFDDPALVDLETEALRETLGVMRAAHIVPVKFDRYPFKVLAPLIRFVPKPLLRNFLRGQLGARGDKMPSLHIDLSAGKQQSEINWLNGAVVAMGEQHGVATPINRLLTETLLALIQAPQARPQWQHNHARLLAAAGQ